MYTSNRRFHALLVMALLAAMAAALLAGCDASGYYDGDDEGGESALMQLA